MRASKEARQNKILELIRHRPVGTQEELVRALEEAGMPVTQATVSRDIKELGIVKASAGDQGPYFVALAKSKDSAMDRLLRVFTDAVISSDVAGNLLIIHTLPGMAGATGAALDAMHLEGVAGTLAGDDTIFLACHDYDAALALRKRLGRLHANIDEPEEDTD